MGFSVLHTLVWLRSAGLLRLAALGTHTFGLGGRGIIWRLVLVEGFVGFGRKHRTPGTWEGDSRRWENVEGGFTYHCPQ